MDIQLVLIFILAILTINLLVVGYYVITVLKEFRETLRKSNQIIDDVQSFTNTIANPLSTLVSFVSGLTSVFKSAKKITSLQDLREDREE